MEHHRLAITLIITLLLVPTAFLLLNRAPNQPTSQRPISTAITLDNTTPASTQENAESPLFPIFTAAPLGTVTTTQIARQRPVELLLQNSQALLEDPYGSYPMETIVQLAEAGDIKAMNRATEWLSSPRTGTSKRFVDLVLLQTALSADPYNLVRAGIQARETRPEIAGGLLLLALNRGYKVEDGPGFEDRQSGFEDFVYQRLNALEDPSRAYARMDEFATKLSIIERGGYNAHR